MSLRILITGANGQLGSEFKRVLDKIGIHFIVQSKKELDFTDLIKLFEIAKTFKPTHVINCTAYNLVDKAESEALNAYRVNTIGVANLSLVCREINAYLIHYSTDYIFDGKKEAPYTEEDTPNPLNEYGKSKLTGEILLKEVWREKSLIFRTSWVYGNGKQNFIYKLNQWAQSQDHLRIACDEFSVPTSTRTIVEVTLKAIDVGLTGLYHLVNSGYASIYEWAKKYFKIKGIDKFIYPAYQSDFNLPAKRPRWSVMSNDKIKKRS
ncbi:MAG: dTDP-4-dehydrorhamnose reductase [Hydrogenothermaceae bacterium]|nr:dTDP-4-dehydrorhamnose reductase [Hydrogenothermaceae bacterium]